MKGFQNLPVCKTHGTYVGRSCPLCPAAAVEEPSAEIPIEEDELAARETWWKGQEKELHDFLESWLIYKGVEYIHSRMDTKSTIESGWEDFTCLYAAEDGICRACCVELKNRTGKLRKDQLTVITRHRERNIPTLVTGNFEESCKFISESLNLKKSPHE
jgi:hypothetical protein